MDSIRKLERIGPNQQTNRRHLSQFRAFGKISMSGRPGDATENVEALERVP